MAETSTAVVILERSQKWYHGSEKWPVYWDDKEMLQLRQGQFHVFQTEPGDHLLYFRSRNARSSTVRIDLAAGQVAWFKLERTSPVFELEDSHLQIAELLQHDQYRLAPPSAESITPHVEARLPENQARTAELKIDFGTALERHPAASEIVNVATGARVVVRRSQTITRTVEVTSNRQTNLEVEVSLLDIVTARIMREASHRESRSVQHSETIECSVDLDSSFGNRWMLTWHDVWCPGRVVGKSGRDRIDSDFRLLQHKELSVEPI